MALEFHKTSGNRHEAVYSVTLDGEHAGVLSRGDKHVWTFRDKNSTTWEAKGCYFDVVRKLRDQLRRNA